MGFFKMLGIFNIYAKHYCPECKSLLERYYTKPLRLADELQALAEADDYRNLGLHYRRVPVFKCPACGKSYSVERLMGSDI